MDGLFEQSLQLKKAYDSSENKTKVEIEYTQYDFMKQSEKWVEHDLIFANATAFTDEMVKSLSEKWMENGKKGSVFILTTKSLVLSEEQAKFIGPVRKMMSWGETEVRAYVKK